jgi:branched-chain amino acid transport system ATP-binding protein
MSKDGKVILEVKDVTKKFGGLTANSDISIYLKEGEILGLIGANGAGKTTLFNMIAGAFHPTSGEIIFQGKHIEKMPAHDICKLGIGRTYQIVQPFSSLTVHENVMVGALLKNSNIAKASKKADEVLKQVGLWGKRDIQGKALSLPELKRMEVARALATDPKVLLLDEVMAGLNPTESANVINLIWKIRDSGITIIIIEHVMKAIMTLSDRIYVLNQGKLIAEGTPEEVAHNEEVQASYFGRKKYA